MTGCGAGGRDLFGVLLAVRLSSYKNILNRLFAGLILVVSGYMLYQSWGEFFA